MIKSFNKTRSVIINYRCFKQLSNEAFRETNNISSEEFVHNDKGQQQFCKVYIKTVSSE